MIITFCLKNARPPTTFKKMDEHCSCQYQFWRIDNIDPFSYEGRQCYGWLNSDMPTCPVFSFKYEACLLTAQWRWIGYGVGWQMLTLAFKLATTDITLINYLVNLVSFSHVCQAIQASIFCPQNKHACGISMIIYSLHFTILFITWWKSLQPFGWCMI